MSGSRIMSFSTRRTTGSIARKPYDFCKERVHLAVDPVHGDPLPTYVCDACKRHLNESHFDIAFNHNYRAAYRLSKFRFASVLHPNCRKCRELLRGQHAKHPLYSTRLDAFFTQSVRQSKSNAMKRGLIHALDKDDVLGMFLDQGGCCSMTGLEFDWETPGYSTLTGRNYRLPSIDRIDSRGNYVLGNVQLITLIANIMKNDLPNDQFIGLCRQIASHNSSL